MIKIDKNKIYDLTTGGIPCFLYECGRVYFKKRYFLENKKSAFLKFKKELRELIRIGCSCVIVED